MPKPLEFYNKELQALCQEDEVEKMVKVGDYANAREKLLQTLNFSSLDHLLPMLTVCDILIASTYQIPRIGTDHYRILHLVPWSSPQEIALQYDKLLNLLQPMKDSLPEATESALEFIQEAFLVLSDSEKHATFAALRKAVLDSFEGSPECSEKGIVADDSPMIDPSSSSSRNIGNASSFEVYPRKGEIWAMYSDLEGRKGEYWIVEIVSEFSDTKMMVARLKEVEGCLTLFQRFQTGGFREISGAGMLGFCHKIRFEKVPDIDSLGVPDDCYQLEAADLPLRK